MPAAWTWLSPKGMQAESCRYWSWESQLGHPAALCHWAVTQLGGSLQLAHPRRSARLRVQACDHGTEKQVKPALASPGPFKPFRRDQGSESALGLHGSLLTRERVPRTGRKE